MSQGIVIDVQAQVTGYQASLKQLEQALQHIDAGSAIGKQLTSAFDEANKQVKALGRNLSQRATSEGQIDAIVEKANRAGIAVQKVAELMQQVTVDNVDFSPIQAELDNLSNSLVQLSGELESSLFNGINNAVTGSKDLADAFERIGVKTEDIKTSGQFFEAIQQKANEAAKAVETTGEALEKANARVAEQQERLTSLQNDPLVKRDDVKDQLRNLVDQYQAPLQKLGESLRANLTSLLQGNSADAEKMAAVFLNGLTPETLKDHIVALKDSVQNFLGKDAISASKIYSSLFGDKGKGGNGQAVATSLMKQLFPPEIVQQIKQQFEQTVTNFSTKFTDTQVGSIKQLISTNDLQAAYQKTAAALDSAYTKLLGEITKQQQRVNEALAQKGTAETNSQAAGQMASDVENVRSQLNAIKENLEKENENLKARIANLEEAIKERKETFVTNLRQSSNKSGDSASQFTISTQEALKYKNALDTVQAGEQMIGKIQGVVQRWFSIYTVVRMTSNAIRNVISVLQELDKTITEIAIVTDMTQSDLWGQMDSYTKMARQYGTSISGVYKVSQLYYQQGLQTAEVMKLTEQTLKMARISGLDYATATDYMTNAIRSFKMEMSDAQKVVDVYSAVAASSATDTSELATAMSKTASSAEAVGSSFENTTAMMAVMIEATRESAENIGSAMKSIISRYGEMTSDPNAITDSEGEAMSLNRVDKALQTVGITIHDTAGQFRDFDDVIMELAQKWDTIDTNTQRYIATIMAGNRLNMLAVAWAA